MPFFRGSKSNDDLLGTPFDDILIGRNGDDTLQGGGGADLVKGGDGDDRLIYERVLNLGEDLNADFYDGGEGADTLELHLTADEWSDPEIYADVIAYIDWLETANSEDKFSFSALGLRVKNVEKLMVYVEGGLVSDPLDPNSQVVFDLSESTENETVDPDGNLNYEITTGSGNDTVVSGSGSDVISVGDGDDEVYSGGGDDIVAIGDGDDLVQAGTGNDQIIAGAGGGVDVIDGGPGSDTVSYPSATNALTIDLRTQDRSALSVGGGATVGATLAKYQGYSAGLHVGLATGVDIDTDILISIENAEGGAGNDTIFGNDDTNRLRGMEGFDNIDGGGGNDHIEGNEGNDDLDGGSGDDRLAGGAGNDVVIGGTGNDTLVLAGDLQDYTVVANPDGTFTFIDSVAGRDGTDTVSTIERIAFSDADVGLWALVGSIDRLGTPNNDVMHGTAAREWFETYAGEDEIYGDAAEDTFIPGSGDDFVDGGTGTDDDANFVWDIINYFNEYLNGGTYGVTVNLTTGVATDTYGDTDTLVDIERVFGTPGDDIIIGSDEWGEAYDPWGGADYIEGRGGFDNLRYNLADGSGYPGGVEVYFDLATEGSGYAIDMTGATDTFSGIESVTGTKYADTFVGGAGQQLWTPLEGADYVTGGEGFDRVSYRQDASYGGSLGIVMLYDADGGERTITDGWGNEDTLLDIEWIIGTGADDYLWGNALDERLEGGEGNDFLRGSYGNDILIGGAGDDFVFDNFGNNELYGGEGNDTIVSGVGGSILSGGLDADTFRFGGALEDDVILDFSVSEDTFELVSTAVWISAIGTADVDGDAFEDSFVTLTSASQERDVFFVNVEAAALETYFDFF